MAVSSFLIIEVYSFRFSFILMLNLVYFCRLCTTLQMISLDITFCFKTTYRRQKMNKDVEDIPKPKSFSRYLERALKVRAISYSDHRLPQGLLSHVFYSQGSLSKVFC
jgi:hypothetical protein